MDPRLPYVWQCAIALFAALGVMLIAYSLDFFVYSLNKGAASILNLNELLWFVALPILFYLGIITGSYFLTRTGRVNFLFPLIFLVLGILISTFLRNYLLPQDSDLIYFTSVFLVGFAAIVTLLGTLHSQTRRR